MKKRMILTTVALVAICFLPVFAQAYAYDEGKVESFRQQKFDALSQELGLSPLQKQTLEKQRAEFAAKRKKIVEKLKADTAKLKEELEKTNIDKAATDRLIEEIKDLNGQQLHNRVDSIIATKKILTPEQFGKLQEKARERHHQFMDRQERFFKEKQGNF